jgi:molecular chaperone GrpE
MSELTDNEKEPSPAAGADADGPAEISAEALAELRGQAQKAAEHWDKYVRLNADFENFKKRAARERQEAVRYANEGLLEKLIPALDNFEMAMQAANTPQGASPDALKTGVKMIASQLKAALAEAGLEEIDAAGQAFNPNWHEAVSQQESADVPEGHVLQQLRRGYKLRDRLLRPATVIVAKKAS